MRTNFMKKLILSAALLFSAALSFAQTPDALKVKTFTLSNGMEVWINEDHSQPKAFGAVVVKAGAKDCPGTGIAHYFEHMMFKGTDKIGTVDYAAEKPYLDSIAVKYDELAIAANDSVRRVIQMEINRLNIAASDYAIPNEFNNLISECGGSNLNAYTSQDITVYHNQFIPSFLEQWAELNSERLISPVFRLFQSELETVYEEKNMSGSNELSAFAQMISSEGFKGSPYEYQVIGTTETLKNPQLSQMSAFFDKYYVAGNMGLMLTGDIDAAKALPILEKTFGRIRKGEAKPAPELSLPAFNGRQEVTALAKIPLIKIGIMCFRAPSKKDADCLPLSLLAFMLNNSEGIGMLDKLTTDHKISGAVCMYPDMAFEQAGLFPVMIMPKLLFQSRKSAERKVMEVLDKVKAGDFTDEFFSSCKLTYKKNLLAQTESIGSRMNEMVNAYSQGKSWNDVIEQADKIDNLTREDIVAIAGKYICDNYLVITKKFGSPERTSLQKPPYRKVTPKNSGASSAYAQAIKKAADEVCLPRVVVDFENGAQRTAITDKVMLYCVENKLNDVFNLTFLYPIGSVECPVIERTAEYLNLIGSQSMDYDEHRARLQALGASMAVSATRSSFKIEVTGFDENFEQTLALVSDLLDSPKGDKKKLSINKENDTMGKIMRTRDIGELNSALYQKVAFGEDSYYLADKGKIDDATILGAFEDLQENEFDIHYSGKLPAETIADCLKKCEFVGSAVREHKYFSSRHVALDCGAKVYFINKPKAPQSRIEVLVPGEKLVDIPSRFASYVFADYMGGGMGSVLFQEIREYRSMAYSTGAIVYKPGYCEREAEPTFFNCYLSTQCDKTIDAMEVLDSLLRNVPLSENRARLVKKNNWIERITDYPGFRTISQNIANTGRVGLDYDAANDLYNLLENYSTEDVQKSWQENLSGRDIIWTVVGDAKKIDMAVLERFGPVVELKAQDVMR